MLEPFLASAAASRTGVPPLRRRKYAPMTREMREAHAAPRRKEKKKEMRTNNKRETMIQQVVKKRIGPPGPTCPGGLLLYPQTSLAKTQ